MKHYLLIFVVVVSHCACINNVQRSSCSNEEDLAETASVAVDVAQTESHSLEDELMYESLNDIRFGDWEYNDWFDNDYFRAIRKHIDAFRAGEIEDSTLEKYRSKIQGKFSVLTAEPYLLGGLYVVVVFIDNPDMSFTTAVGSDVDVETREVSNYRLGSFKADFIDFGLTKEKILEIFEEHPENFLW